MSNSIKRNALESQLTQLEIEEVKQILKQKLKEKFDHNDDGTFLEEYTELSDVADCVFGEEDQDVKKLKTLVERYQSELGNEEQG